MPETPGHATLPPLEGGSPFVSVIVPAYEAPEALARCLASLERQTWPADRYEVIVVDNGSRANLGVVVAAHAHARHSVETAPGSYAARNRGLQRARGAVLAFTDADCLPAEDWIERGVAALRAFPSAGFVAGRVDLFVQDPARPTAAELYDLTVLNFRQEENVRVRGFAATANMFARPEVFARVGPFDPRLRSAGDLDWGRRAIRAGLPGAYADAARVRHPARRTLDETLRRAARVEAGIWQSREPARATALHFAVHLARKLVPAVHFYARLLGTRPPERWVDRLRVVRVALAVKYAEAGALIRLAMGGAAERR